MEEEFPNLNENQYALVICEFTTGIVLDENMNYSTGLKSSYFIFESLNSAQLFIEENNKPNTCFEIFDKDKSLVLQKCFDSELKYLNQ